VRVEQAIVNLLENAVQGSPEGAEVSLEARRRVDDRVELCVHNEGEPLAAEVIDNLFRPFWRTGKTGGDGLGLAIVKSIALAHRGAVWATNPPEGGVSFHLTLPVAPPWH
jgi:signal transduction histidine kinase